ncbi:aldo/keto reductase [Ectobacillus sp. sgz5001026]|uniref:aldo/keto reductase n=1 Tax=Ectobacillus sp. sgz5001026 TaxID=3242473 RepID=UPI0036D26EA7
MLNQTAIPLRTLGKTELEISALGLGCWQFSKGSGMVGRFWPVLSQDDIRNIVKTSLQGGINWFDTAEVYGKGQSEEALAEALVMLGEEAKDALVATKWWPLFRSASSITATIDNRIHALKGRTIDLYQIHQPYALSNVRSQLIAMASLIKEGKIRYAGVSNFNESKMREAHTVLQEFGYPLASNQVKYSLLDRRIEKNGIMDAAKELGITIIAYSPLEQGILSGKFHKNPELVKKITGPRKYLSYFKPTGLAKTKPLIDLLDKLALEYNVTTSQIALNWLIHFHGDTVVAIPGASKIRHAEENIGTLGFKLSEQHLNEIDRMSKQVTAN